MARAFLMVLFSGLIAFGQQSRIAALSGAKDSLHQLSDSIEVLSQTVSPAVVQVFSTGYALANDEEEAGDASTAGLVTKQRSSGSGVVLSPDGFIITNNHVVRNARRVRVQLASPPDEPGADPSQRPLHAHGKLLEARVVGVDREADLAVLKVEPEGRLPVLKLSDSDTLRQGQVVLAFGNPLGLENSVSIGIVSSVGRQVKPDDPMVYIQTDAPINPGNSGGPLLDADGNVVGINTFILSQSGGSEGIGFAIPSNSVRNVYEQIRKDGHVHRGQIGVVAQTISPAMAKALGLSQDWGVVAADVTPDGPADKAGMKVRDIILTLNGHAMEDAPHLETAIRRLKLSEVVDVTVQRDTQKINFTIPVIERDDDPQRFADMVNPEDNLISKLGILGIEINKKLSDMLGTLRHEYGIVVAARGSSPPYSGGALEVGDVIYEISRTPTVTVKALRASLDALKPGDSAVLQIERNSKLMYITIELE
jgi:serine protease Do